MDILNRDDIMNLIVKDLSGFADEKESNQLKAWLNSSSRNHTFYEQIKNIWYIADNKTDPAKVNVPLAWEKVVGRIPELSERKNLWFYWQKIAAILILPVLIGGLMWIYSLSGSTELVAEEVVYNEMYTPTGTRSSLVLSDSTVVWLNSGSSLKYPVKFTGSERTVYLQGEAYFEVKSDALKPFFVETSDIEVKATGTRFSVSNYSGSDESEVTLISGRVSVNEPESRGNTQAISVLSPDQHLIYNRDTKGVQTSFGDTYKYISWKDGVLMFRNEPLEKVLNKISMYFDVEIEIRGDEIKSYSYYATFKDESLEEILKLLRLSAPINYTEVKRNPLPDGSFPRKKVIIWQMK